MSLQVTPVSRALHKNSSALSCATQIDQLHPGKPDLDCDKRRKYSRNNDYLCKKIDSLFGFIRCIFPHSPWQRSRLGLSDELVQNLDETQQPNQRWKRSV